MFFQQHLNVPCIPEIKAVRPAARDNIVLSDMEGYAAKCDYPNAHCYYGEEGHSQYLNGLRNGDLSLVERSDQYLAKMEERGFLSKAWATTLDVVGATPNVPAYIAGQPMNMRRRYRTKKPSGPLSIFLEATGSAGAMSEAETMERGSAMLALVRILSEQRPVDIWACITYGSQHEMNALLVRLETVPLDLGRAAHMLVKLQHAACYGHRVLTDVIGHQPGSWSYGTPELERKYCGEIFRRFLHPNSDILYVPAAYTRDTNIAKPAQWLNDMLVKYGGETVEGADESVPEINTAPIEGPGAVPPPPMPTPQSNNPPHQPRRYRRRRRF